MFSGSRPSPSCKINGDEVTQVAIVEFNGDVSASMQEALQLLGGIGELNTPQREVTIKVGAFHPGYLNLAYLYQEWFEC